MDPSIVVQGVGLGAVVLLMMWETHANLQRAHTRRARARESSAPQRCPFCHNGFESGEESGRCRACGTSHHLECWEEHGQCTLMGCPSLELEQELHPRPAVTESASHG